MPAPKSKRKTQRYKPGSRKGVGGPKPRAPGDEGPPIHIRTRGAEYTLITLAAVRTGSTISDVARTGALLHARNILKNLGISESDMPGVDFSQS